VLLLFAIGVLILSIVMPRIQERRKGFETEAPKHAVSVYGVVSQEGQKSGPGNGPDAPVPPGETT
jgi:hypothetical protein